MAELFKQILAWGPLGVAVVALLDSAGVPLPTGVDALLIATAAYHPGRAYLAALLAIAGSAAGNLILFSIARKGQEAYLDRHAISPRARRFRAWFQHYGLISVFIPAFVPIVPLPLKVFVLSAGALGVGTRAFLLTILAARIPRFLAMAYLGTQLGDNAMQWLLDHKWHLAGIAAGMFVALYAAVRVVDRRRRPGRDKQPHAEGGVE
ncbi:MAG: VTT domain-containing protein [Bryobacteraceae bacterium]|nr:VTT domain-containing protein [Bryobacteraceae bacterium]